MRLTEGEQSAVVTILFIDHNNLEREWLEHCQGDRAARTAALLFFTGLWLLD